MIKSQRIIFPWELKSWNDIREKIMSINSIVDMDAKISAIFIKKIRPKQITELFNIYYTDEQYAADRQPQDFFITKLLPMMQKLISDAPKIFKNMNSRVLLPNVNTNIVFTRVQVATIITCIWFGLLNYNYLSKGAYTTIDFPEPTFINIFIDQNVFALQCLINYFTRIHNYLETNSAEFQAGIVIVKRNVLTESINWIESDAPITDVHIGTDESLRIITAYAHELIGGNEPFRKSLTQEEIILLTHPECIVTTLFCCILRDNESILSLGAEKISKCSGYGSSVKFVGNHNNIAPRGVSPTGETLIQRGVIFIDACSRTSSKSQFIDDFARDLDKAYCGFSSINLHNREKIASGHWTYGFNGGNVQIKFIQQLLAASLAQKSLVYLPPCREFEDEVLSFIEWLSLERHTVGSLFADYIELMESNHNKQNSRLSDIDIFNGFRDL